MKVCLLTGGTGGARLAAGLDAVLAPGSLSVVANTADDCEFWGLRVSPDMDAVLYRLAGIFNEPAGFGVRGETFNVLEALGRLGEETWFKLGDRDLATHVLRTQMLREGRRPTEVALELGSRLGLKTRVLPMTDDSVATFFETDRGRVGFQEYFVRDRCEPAVKSLEVRGMIDARPSPEAADAVAAADLVVIGPSNPVISIAPILALVGGFLSRDRTVAVSPLVQGRALKGPTVQMIRAVGGDPTAAGVAASYRRSAAWFVLDERDAALAPAVEALDYRVLVTDTLMNDAAGERRLAEAILPAVGVGA
jgi:LPPG:FO 2-phospho-L-lactate transferase